MTALGFEMEQLHGQHSNRVHRAVKTGIVAREGALGDTLAEQDETQSISHLPQPTPQLQVEALRSLSGAVKKEVSPPLRR